MTIPVYRTLTVMLAFPMTMMDCSSHREAGNFPERYHHRPHPGRPVHSRPGESSTGRERPPSPSSSQPLRPIPAPPGPPPSYDRLNEGSSINREPARSLRMPSPLEQEGGGRTNLKHFGGQYPTDPVPPESRQESRLIRRLPRVIPRPAGSGQEGGPDNLEDPLKLQELLDFQQVLRCEEYDSYELRDLGNARFEDLVDEQPELTPEQARRIVTHFDPEIGTEGVLQEDYRDGQGLQPIPRGRCRYMGNCVRRVGLEQGRPVFWEMRVWEMMEEAESVHLYTDTSAWRMHEGGPQDAWWHESIISSSDEVVLNDLKENNVQLCWKDQ